MLHLFSKKSYLVDLLEGVPEIHCHVLPGIDDGAATKTESLELLKAYKEIGISQIIATPHSMGALYENTPETIKAAFENVTNKTEDVSLHYASEYLLDDYFEKLLRADKILPLRHNYILVELSFYQPPINLDEILYEITTSGFVPVLAHPERYAYYHKDLTVFERLIQKGCLLQLNALSLSNHYGVRMQRAAFELLKRDHYSFVGTDTHRMEHLAKIKEIQLSKRDFLMVEKLTNKTKEVFSW